MNWREFGSIQRVLIQHLSDIHIYRDLLEMEPAVKEIPCPVSLPAVAGKIEFLNVSFRYPEAPLGPGQDAGAPGPERRRGEAGATRPARHFLRDRTGRDRGDRRALGGRQDDPHQPAPARV